MPDKYTGEVGCLVGGHHGQYGIDEVIGIALSYGMLMEDRDAEVLEHRSWDRDFSSDYVMSDDDHDYLIEWANGAEEWLNENVAEDGFSFGWHDGEFFYQSEQWWEEESY